MSDEDTEYLITCQVRYRTNKKGRFVERPATINPKQTFSIVPLGVAKEAGLTEGNEFKEAEMKLEAKVNGTWVSLADSAGSERVLVTWFEDFPEWHQVTLSGDVLKHSKKTTVVAVESSKND